MTEKIKKRDENNFRSIIEAMNQAVIISRENVIQYLNPMARAWTGYSENSSTLTSIADFIHPEDRDTYVKDFQKGTPVKGEQYQYRIITKTGDTKWVMVSATKVQWEGHPASVTTLTDITDFKQKALRLETWKHNTEKYMDLSAEAIMFLGWDEPMDINLPEEEQIDFVYKHVYMKMANDAYAKMAGYEHGKDMVGLRLYELMPPDIPENIASVRKNIRASYNLLNFETVEIYPTGVERILLNNSMGVLKERHLVGMWATALDITERKAAEKRLMEEQLRYRTVADFTYDWEYWELPDGSLAYVSPSCERITGYDSESYLENPGLLMEIVVPEDRKILKGHQTVLGEGEQAQNVVYRIIRKDGVLRWIERTSKIVLGDQDEFLGIRGSNRDITNRQRTEDELRESEAKLSALINNTDEQICSRDREGDLVVWNAAFADAIRHAFGVEPYVGMRTVDYIPLEQKDNFNDLRERLKRLFDGEKVKDEFSYQLPSGETNYYEIAWSPIFKGSEITGYVELTRNVTDKKRSEIELRDAKQQYKMIADFTYSWEYWRTPEGDLKYVSPSCERISGYTSNEFKAKPSLLNEIILAEDQEKWTAHEREASHIHGHLEAQFRIQRKDGDIRWIDHVCQPVFDSSNQFVGYRASNRDITEQRRAEREAKQTQGRTGPCTSRGYHGRTGSVFSP